MSFIETPIIQKGAVVEPPVADARRQREMVHGREIMDAIRSCRGQRDHEVLVRILEDVSGERSPAHFLDVGRRAGECGGRCLYLAGAVDPAELPRSVAAAAPETSVEIRVTRERVPSFAIVGDDTAFVPLPGPSALRFELVRSPTVVRLLVALHALAWRPAVPLTPAGRDGCAPHLRGVLEQARMGATDCSAQRALNMSSRTHSRRMSELLSELNAHSRFQAGVEAARRGWV